MFSVAVTYDSRSSGFATNVLRCPSLPSSLSMDTSMRHLTSLHDLAFRSTPCTMRLSAHPSVSSCVIAIHAALTVPSWLFSQFCMSFSLFLASCFSDRVKRNTYLTRGCSLTSLSICVCDEHATMCVVVRLSDVPRLLPLPSPCLPPLAPPVLCPVLFSRLFWSTRCFQIGKKGMPIVRVTLVTISTPLHCLLVRNFITHSA